MKRLLALVAACALIAHPALAQLGTANNPMQISVSDGASVTLGSKADSTCATAGGTCTAVALQKFSNAELAALVAGLITPPLAVTGTQGADGSGTITTGGTAQNLFSGATPTNGFEVCNPNLSDDLWISQSTTALANGTGSIRIVANGGCYDTPSTFKPFHAVGIVAATTSDKFTAISW